MRLDRAIVISAIFISCLLASCGDDNGGSDGGGRCSPLCGENQVCNADDRCECAPFTTGSPATACVPDCSATGCTNGRCMVGEDEAYCSCFTGWQGDDCATPVNACVTNPDRCMNDGTCVSTGPNNFTCDCPEGYTGGDCGMEAQGCALRPCTQGYCAQGGAPGAVTCSCEFGYQGETCGDEVANVCAPNPCGDGTCAPVVGEHPRYTCTCPAGRAGTNCEVAVEDGSCGAYVDIVYRVVGQFRVANTPLNAGNVTATIGENGSLPDFAYTETTTPFTPAAFSRGFIRLRFHNTDDSDDGAPGTGPVQIVEWYMPIELDVSGSAIPTVSTNVDHSAGLVALTNRYAARSAPLARSCTAVADGTLTGTTLTWGTCGVMPTGTTQFRYEVAQADVDESAGCLRRMSSSGNARCVAGQCGLVPNATVGDQLASWDQPLEPFVFSPGDLAEATFTMEEVQIPNNTGTTTWFSILSATPLLQECDDTPTCVACLVAEGCGP